MAKRRYKRKKNKNLLIKLLGVFFVMAFCLILMVKGYHNYTQNQLETPVQTEEAYKKAFILKIANHAQVLQEKYQILPSITIGQAILESNWGKSDLAAKYHNYFGVKGSDPSNTQLLTTKEYVNGQWIEITARFRVYEDYKASMNDHALLFVNGTKWNAQQYQHVLAATDYYQAAYALKQDGYATDPTYPEKLIAIIEQYQLAQFD